MVAEHRMAGRGGPVGDAPLQPLPRPIEERRHAHTGKRS